MSTAPQTPIVERRYPQQQLALRITLWGALLVIHSLLLAVAFCLVQMRGTTTGLMVQAFAWFAFLGLLAPLMNISSSLAELREALAGKFIPGSDSSAVSSWSAKRPGLWALLELFSLAMLSFCGAIMVFVVTNSG